MDKSLLQLFRLNQTVFSFKELLLLWHETNTNAAKARVHYYIKRGHLYPIRRGLYGKDAQYDRLELATKLYAPAYISFETVLREAGVLFQVYQAVCVAASCSKAIECDGQEYVFRQIKDPILMNAQGLERHPQYFIASKERAFLDILYLNKDYHFDNIAPLDVKKIEALLPLYHNERMKRKVNEHFKQSLA